MKNDLITEFKPKASDDEAMGKWMDKKQTTNIEEHNQEMRRLKSLIKNPVSEQAEIVVYIRSLNEKLKSALEMERHEHKEKTLEQLMEIAKIKERSFGENYWKKQTVPYRPTFQYSSSSFQRSSQPATTGAATPPVANAMNAARNQPGPRSYFRLSDEENQRCRDNGLCFRCKKQGHISMYCPDRTWPKNGLAQSEI